MTESTLNANVDPAEIGKFERMASRWWDPNGEFKPLHELNPVRANYIDEMAPVAGKHIVDVGCGGGLLCEALAQRGAHMTGIDMGTAPLEVAQLHALESKLEIHYVQNTAEAFADTHKGEFDHVTCLEMLEHVPDPASTVKACAELVRPGGSVFFSTINRNPKAYAMAILGAEYLLQWLPKGTHEYKKFIRPSELSAWIRAAGLQVEDIRGVVFNPLTKRYRLSERDVDVNYMIAAKKPL